MSEPLVSIIVPSYNQGQFIGATIDSILEQDYTNLECIVVDGGSTDTTVDVLQRYDDPRLTWVSEKDKGQSDAINKGLRRAKGAILSYLNSDDLLLPGAIAFAVRYFAEHPAVDLLYGDGCFVDAEGERISAYTGSPFDLKLCVLNGQNLAQPGAFWRAAVTETIGEFETDLHYRMDFDYWIRAALAKFRLQYVPGERAAYRLHGESKTISQRAAFAGDWAAILTKIYARDDLPAAVVDAKHEAFSTLAWWETRNLWLEGKYAEANPRLRRFLGDPKWGRRLLAATMLIDGHLHTPLTKILALVYYRLTGSEVIFSEQRVT